MRVLMVIFTVVLIIVSLSTECHSFAIRSALGKLNRKSALSMSSSPLNDILGMMPLCLTATSKTTTTNDPTAGMSPEEIVNYISNVGGGMCGYPEWVRASIGVGLNLSLIVFGLATVSYVVLSGVQFSLESQVEDETKKADKNRAVGVPRMAAAPESSQVEDQGMASFDSTVTDMNRSTRRMKQRLGTDKDKK